MSKFLGGHVTNAATKLPLADVIVTATSPSLQGEQVVVTDRAGEYLLRELPPGIYQLTFEIAGFEACKRSDFRLSEGMTRVRVNAGLIPTSIG